MKEKQDRRCHLQCLQTSGDREDRSSGDAYNAPQPWDWCAGPKCHGCGGPEWAVRVTPVENNRR